MTYGMINANVLCFTIQAAHHDQNSLDGTVSYVDLKIEGKDLPEAPGQSHYPWKDNSVQTTRDENIQWPVLCLQRHS